VKGGSSTDVLPAPSICALKHRSRTRSLARRGPMKQQLVARGELLNSELALTLALALAVAVAIAAAAAVRRRAITTRRQPVAATAAAARPPRWRRPPLPLLAGLGGRRRRWQLCLCAEWREEPVLHTVGWEPVPLLVLVKEDLDVRPARPRHHARVAAERLDSELALRSPDTPIDLAHNHTGE